MALRTFVESASPGGDRDQPGQLGLALNLISANFLTAQRAPHDHFSMRNASAEPEVPFGATFSSVTNFHPTLVDKAVAANRPKADLGGPAPSRVRIKDAGATCGCMSGHEAGHYDAGQRS